VDRRAPVRREANLRERLRLVAQILVLYETVRDVDAEAVDAAVEPEAEDCVEVLAHLWVVPVEIRLLRREEMQIPVPALLVERPRRAAPVRRPVVRRSVAGVGDGDVAR